MQFKHFIALAIFIVFSCTDSSAQKQYLYKQIDTTQLFMEVYYPTDLDSSIAYPAMVFFFGGGWNTGSIDQFEAHARFFSQRGMVCFLVDYRVKKRQKTSPFESLKDAKTAIRFIRENASDFCIDTSKVIASGGSSGGHLAAATALIHKYDEESDDTSISCIPNALVLYNPVIDNGPGGFGYERIGDNYKDFSPLHNIRKNAPPTIFLLGTKDRHVPVETAKYYQKVMEKVKSRCELFIYEGQAHGFFNYENIEFYKLTVSETDTFLQSLGYLEEEPVIKIE